MTREQIRRGMAAFAGRAGGRRLGMTRRKAIEAAIRIGTIQGASLTHFEPRVIAGRAYDAGRIAMLLELAKYFEPNPQPDDDCCESAIQEFLETHCAVLKARAARLAKKVRKHAK